MKNALLIYLILLCSATLFAQDWQTDFEKAKEIASQEDRPIILVFQGSDWCAPCIKLDQEIWSTEEFKSYSKAHYVMLKADFPRSKKNALSPEQQERNNTLAETYNRSGYFPYVVVLDKEGNVLGSTGYKKMTPTEYIEHLNSLKS